MERTVTLNLSIRPEDGALVITSSDVEGLFLAHEPNATWRDLGPALQMLLAHNYGWPEWANVVKLKR